MTSYANTIYLQKGKQLMTMEEMARIIGVSRITLSKVMNDKEGVSEKTRERVKEYIKKYNFEPNSQARSLVGKKEPIIGFFTTYSEESSGSTHITSHFATELVNLVVNAAQKRDYKTLVDITGGDDDFSDIERYLSSGLVRGAILLGYATGNKKLERLSQKGIPLVLINQEEETDLPNIMTVNMNDEVWAFEAIERLVKLQHKRILYIGCSRNRLPAMCRAHGVHRACDMYKDQILSYQERNGDFNEDLAYDITKEIFSAGGETPTGIFAANDLMAIGAVNALKDMGIRIPEEVSVIGFDDITFSRYLTPSLSTVHCDFRMIAEKSVKTLIDSIEGKKVQRHQELDLEFIERESLGRCR